MIRINLLRANVIIKPNRKFAQYILVHSIENIIDKVTKEYRR